MGDNLLDMGSPLMPVWQMKGDGREDPLNNEAGGYSIIQAKDLAHARALLKGHPHLEWTDNSYIQLFEIFSMNQAPE